MDLLTTADFWIGLAKIVWVNLLLSGDNAVVIALAARALPPADQRRAILWGSVTAILLRVLLTLFAATMLSLPYLKIVGGILLLGIGVHLLARKSRGPKVESSRNLMAAIRTILVADAVMSLDNVIALAAAAQAANSRASAVLLVLGLIISVPIVIFGSTLVLRLARRVPLVTVLGAALLGWIAGEMAITDPALFGLVQAGAAWMLDWKTAELTGVVAVIGIGLALARRTSQAAVEPRPDGV